MTITSETSIVFRKVGGHTHDGLTSSLIDTTKYSMFDFSPVLNGAADSPRRRFQNNNEILIKKFIVDTIEERVLNPQGIEIKANVITARNIATNTITANELATNIALVNNVIRSNSFDGVFTYNPNTGYAISNIGTSGWAITSSGQAIFNNAILRGNITANTGSIAGWTISNTQLSSAYSGGKGLVLGSLTGISSYNNSNVSDTYESIMASGGFSSERLRNNAYTVWEVYPTQVRHADYFANTPVLNNNLQQGSISTSQFYSFAKRMDPSYTFAETARMIHFGTGTDVYGVVEVFRKGPTDNLIQRVTMNGIDGSIYASGTKNFRINHPIYNDKMLIHASIEGPSPDVVYRGNSKLIDGKVEIILPDYFELLTHTYNRTVYITAKASYVNEQIAELACSKVIDGKFNVFEVNSIKNPNQEFDWLVIATRSDIQFSTVIDKVDMVG